MNSITTISLTKNQRLKFLSLFFLFFLSACATYQDQVAGARDAISSGDTEKALKELKPKADKPSDDQLIYVLDYATALQYADRIDESNKYFMMADKLAEVQDYHSVSKVAGSMFLNEEMVQY